ncbi:MAG TPA: DoxX family protein [Thermoanaerobaculia bacterium]|nr:DoxX family protein [Thermoanaerobaculia bacterium]
MRESPGSVPRRSPGVDAGLLLLRIGLGLSLLLFFGTTKLHDAITFLRTGRWSFVDFNRRMGLPAPVLVAWLQTANESAGALLVAAGLATRWAAGFLGLGFTVATWCSLRAKEPAWMTAAYFALMALTLALTGPGTFSLDSVGKTRRPRRRRRAVEQ